MGGYGSGGANRRHDHLEGRRRISVGHLRRQGLLRPGVISSFSWKDHWDRPTGSIQIVGGSDCVTLLYSVREGDEDWRRVEERIPLTHVPKPLGGKQSYLACPACGRRVVELAMGNERFRCRRCLGLVHASSQESATDRAMRKANKLKRRLGADPGLDSWYQRPKRMRRTTFDRIDARIRSAEAEVNDAHIQLLARLGRQNVRRSTSAKARESFW